MVRLFLLAFAFGGVFAWGMAAAHYQIFPYLQLLDAKEYVERHVLGLPAWRQRDVAGRKRVACPARQEALVVLVMGQSNAANYGNTPSVAGPKVVNFFAGRCYRARDPMLGADGDGGTYWPALGEKLAGMTGKTVVLLNHAIGHTVISEWERGAFGMLTFSLGETRRLAAAGLRVDLVLWHQGETDGEIGTNANSYARLLASLIGKYREAGVDAPWIVALTSRTDDRTYEQIRLGQRRVIDTDGRVFAGPDSDPLAGKFYRYDGSHFNANGTRAMAALWFTAIKRSAVLKPRAKSR